PGHPAAGHRRGAAAGRAAAAGDHGPEQPGRRAGPDDGRACDRPGGGHAAVGHPRPRGHLRRAVHPGRGTHGGHTGAAGRLAAATPGFGQPNAGRTSRNSLADPAVLTTPRPVVVMATVTWPPTFPVITSAPYMPPPPPFTVGTLTASDAPAAILTATSQRTGG